MKNANEQIYDLLYMHLRFTVDVSKLPAQLIKNFHSREQCRVKSEFKSHRTGLWYQVWYQIYRALYEEAMLVPLSGVGTWRPYNNRNICHCVSLLKRSVITLELPSSSARTVQLATTKAKTHLLTNATALSGRYCNVTPT